MTIVRKILVLTVLLCVSSIAVAERSSALSSDFPDRRALAVQDKADKLFDAGEFERSFFIYRNELAPIGDQYAQYMVGFMYQNGLGVAKNNVSAAAWYRLAAERGTREFVVVRDTFFRGLEPPDAAASKIRYRELRLKYSDLAVLLSSIKRDLIALNRRSASRASNHSSSVKITTVARNSAEFNVASSNYDRGQIRELEAQLRQLKEVGKFQDLDVNIDRVNIRELERRVEQRILAEAD